MAEQEWPALSDPQALTGQAERTEQTEHPEPDSTEQVFAALDTVREETGKPAVQSTSPKQRKRKNTPSTGRAPSRQAPQKQTERAAKTGVAPEPASPVTKAKTPRKKSPRTTPAKAAKTAKPVEAAEQLQSVQTEIARDEIPEQTGDAPKKPKRATKAAGDKPRASRSRKKPAPVAEPVMPPATVEEAFSGRDFEPELEPTPRKPRKPAEAGRRSALFSDIAPDTPATEAEQPLFELDETLKRPSVRLQPVIDTPTIQEVVNIPDTPLAPYFDGELIPDTPVPLADGEEASLAPEAPIAIKTPIIETKPVVALEQPQPSPTAPIRKPIRARVALVLLVLMGLSIATMWRDVSQLHLYLYSINPLDAQVNAQQDLGSDTADSALLTNPALLNSSLLLGLPGSQHILSLNGGDRAWSVAQEINAPLPIQSQATLSVAPNQELVVTYPGGVQVLRPDGSLLWQTQTDGPSHGVHAFAPAIDTTTLYIVSDASSGEIAAFTLNSGTPRWTEQLRDSFHFTPPMLFENDTLYVAGDHTLYALNSADGSLRWQAALPARTLLLDQGGSRPLLIAAGASGLTAFDAQTGVIAWSFSAYPGAPESVASNGADLTNAQLYQAAFSPTNQMVYATGIVWDRQQAREHLWLFAVDASTGAPRWSEQVGSDVSSADAGRILAPFVDTALSQVMLEVAQGDGSHTLSAYDSGSGSLRWSIRLAGVTAFAPTLFQTTNNSISMFVVQADMSTALHSWSWPRILLLALSIVSFLLLLGIWIVPPASWRQRTSTGLKAPGDSLRNMFQQPKRAGRRRASRLLVAGCIVVIITGAGSLAFLSINQPQRYVSAVGASSGSTQWQHALDTPAALSGADGRESFVVLHTSSSLSVLSALNSNGLVLWSTPASEGVYSLPPVQTAPGTLLVALSGPTTPHYLYAPNDSGYPQLAAHLFSLSLLDSATGRILWQTMVIGGDEAQDTTILGADARYTYVASRSIASPGQTAVAQLIAVDTASGAIAWRVYGPREEGTPDFGALLSNGRLLFWQVASTVYALDTQLGQIQWRTPVAETNATSALIEESQMALNAGVLLIRRSDQYHALALPSGTILWSISGLGSATPQAPGGILVANGTLILYSGDTIEALDAATRAVLWQHTNLANIMDAVAAPDGSLVYAIVLDGQDGAASTSHQALVAFDVADSSIRWTFQPSAQALFLYPGVPALRMAHGMLYVTLCMTSASSGPASSCSSQVLYGLNGATGSVAWQFGADQVTSVQVSQDGSDIIFQSSSSLWETLKARLVG
jgi:outer membrane protein assembly factor BamB